MPGPDIRVRLSAEGVAEVVGALQKVRAEAQATGARAAAGLAPLNSVLAGVKNMLLSLAAAFSVGALIAFAKHAAEVGDQVGKMAQKLGASTETTAGLMVVGRMAGVEINGLQQALGQFAKQTVAVTAGSGKASDAFRRLGISAADLRGRDLAQQLLVVSAAMAKLKDGPEKAAIAMELFSRSGMAIVPFLNELGNVGETRLRKIGEFFTSETVANVTALGASFRLLTFEIEAIGVAVVSGASEPIRQSIRQIEADLDLGAKGWIGYGQAIGNVLKWAIFYITDFTDAVIQDFGTLFIKLKASGTAYLQWLTWQFKDSLKTLSDGERAAAAWWEAGQERHMKRLEAVMAPAPATLPGGGKGAPGVGDRAAAAAASAAAAEAELKLREAQLKTEAALEKAAFEQGLTGLADYYGRRRGLLMIELKAEMTALDERAAAVRASGKDEKEIAIDLAGVASQRALKLEEMKAKTIALSEEERVARKHVADEIVAGYLKSMQAQGQLHEAAMSAIDDEVARFALALKQFGMLAPEERAVEIARVREVLELRESFDDLQRRLRAGMSEVEKDMGTIEPRVRAGQMSIAEGEVGLLALRKDGIRALESQAEELARFADLLKDPELQRQARELAAAIGTIDLRIQDTAATLDEFKVKLGEALLTGLTEFFSTGIREARSFGEAVQSMAASVVNALQSIFARALAIKLLGPVFTFLGLPAPRMAAGGLVRGPGTATSDSVPAMLSRGEYVIRASVVAMPGVLRQLEDLNRGLRLPAIALVDEPRRFAAGGLVGRDGAAGRLDSRLTVGLDEGLILKHLESPQAQRVIVRTLARNARAVRQALGG